MFPETVVGKSAYVLEVNKSLQSVEMWNKVLTASQPKFETETRGASTVPPGAYWKYSDSYEVPAAERVTLPSENT